MRRCLSVDVKEQRGQLLDSLQYLSDERRKKALSYHFEKDRLLSIAAGLFIGYIESTYHTEIGFNANEKPYASNGNVEFNISHSGHYVVFAESDLPVGIDIEEMGHHKDIYKNVMTDDEYHIFMGYPDNVKDDLFCRMWTVKESYMKAVGSGLTIAPDTFSVITDNGISCDLPHDLKVRELDAPDGYHASVCSTDVDGFILKNITVSDLIKMIEKGP